MQWEKGEKKENYILHISIKFNYRLKVEELYKAVNC